MSKTSTLIEMLKEGWVNAAVLEKKFGWKPPTLRGVLSDLGRKRGLKIEHDREHGVTSYRITGGEGAAEEIPKEATAHVDAGIRI